MLSLVIIRGDIWSVDFIFLEKQTFIDFEVIFVDDCSTDDTYCQLEKYQQQSILSIRIIRNIKNSGPGESRNYGIKMAKGDYIAFWIVTIGMKLIF